MMYEVEVQIKGVAPLIQHRFGEAAVTEAKAVKKQSGQQDYSEEWRDTIYVDEKGQLYEPASHIEGALIKAATSFKIKGRGKKTFKDLTKAAVYVDPQRIYLHQNGSIVTVPDNPTSNPEEPFSVDIRPVVVSRSRVLRSRGMVAKGWTLDFNITVIDEQLPSDVLNEILTEAGRAQGIGDYRPRFGRFIVTKFNQAS